MKQIPLTPEIISKIQAVAGADVATEGLAVFEAIALNTLPLPGKSGGLFENAVVTPMTLRMMADYITSNGVPLCEDHNTNGSPMGKLFDAEVITDNTGMALTAELRVLFYLDPTEAVRIAKLNAGSIDEVSVGFLAAAIFCSECAWDYLGTDAEFTNIYTRTCANGHVIGTDGTHVNLSGLSQFYETSLVTRGAASKPKIVGKSSARVPSATSQRLAARGFEIDALALTASKGEDTVDFEKLVAQLTAATSEVAVMKAAQAPAVAALTAAETQVAALTAQVATLTASLAEAETAKNVTAVAELATAREALTAQFSALVVATGETGVEVPTAIADLKAGIDTRTVKLTALIPVGGVSQAAGDLQDAKPSATGAAFKLAK